MAKQYSIEEIVKELKDSQGALFTDNSGIWGYVLHHDGEKFVSHCGNDIETFFEPAPYIDELSAECSEHHPEDEDAAAIEFQNRVYDLECESNPGFMDVAEGLKDQVNHWLLESEED